MARRRALDSDSLGSTPRASTSNRLKAILGSLMVAEISPDKRLSAEALHRAHTDLVKLIKELDGLL